jgi:hypothetical protein
MGLVYEYISSSASEFVVCCKYNKTNPTLKYCLSVITGTQHYLASTVSLRKPCLREYFKKSVLGLDLQNFGLATDVDCV